MEGDTPQSERRLIRQLRSENAQLRTALAAAEARAERAEARLAAAEARVATLEGELAKVLAALDEARRAGKRQAAPFRKQAGGSEATRAPKKPGRKAGDEHGAHARRETPKHIDETYDAALPERCPGCGGDIEHTATADQYQAEIVRTVVHRCFRVRIGTCRCCQRRVQGRHPLQTSDALGAAASQLGPDAHAALTLLNKQMGLSHGKCQQVMNHLFGLELARGTSARSMLRTARRCHNAYAQIHASVADSKQVVADETGWRVGGAGHWLHTFVGDKATYYTIDPGRGHQPAANLLGIDYDGTLVHDGWAPYERFRQASHQQCLAHLLRRANDLLEVATRGAVRFPRAVKRLLKEALALRDEYQAGQATAGDLREAADRLSGQIRRLTHRPRGHPGNERFAAHLYKHIDSLFTFLRKPGVDATNWRAETAIRPAVVNRKVWGGNRTPRGAHAQCILMSLLETLHRLAADPLAYLSQALKSGQAAEMELGR